MSGPGISRLEYGRLAFELVVRLRSQPPSTKTWTCPTCRLRAPRSQPRREHRPFATGSRRSSQDAATSDGDVESSTSFTSFRNGANPTVTSHASATTAQHSRAATIASQNEQQQFYSPTEPGPLLPHRQRLSQFRAVTTTEQLRHKVMSALASADPDIVLETLQNLSLSYPQFIRTLPRTTWSKCLKAILSKTSRTPLHHFDRALSQRQQERVGITALGRLKTFEDRLAGILKVQKQAGIVPELAEYAIFLKVSGIWGYGRAATALWRQMQKGGIRPDMYCYNQYISALLLNVYDRRPYKHPAQDVRKTANPKVTDITLFETTNLPLIGVLFSEVETLGLQRDLTSYCLEMIALGRQAKLKEACEIMKSIWGIDVQAIAQQDGTSQAANNDSELPPHLYPAPLLLTAITEIFGQNNRITEALRVLEHVSQRFDVPIERDIWYGIMRWTLVQSRVRPSRKLNSNEPRILASTVEDLFAVMLAPPYSVKPDAELYDLLFCANLALVSDGYGSTRPWFLINFMWTGRKLFQESREKYYALLKVRDKVGPYHSELPQIKQRVQSALARKSCEEQFVRKWAHQILWMRVLFPREDDHEATRQYWDWHLRGIPNFIKEFQTFAPPVIKYTLHNSGEVQFRFKPRLKNSDSRL